MIRMSYIALPIISFILLFIGVADAQIKDPSEFKLGFSVPQLANPWFVGAKLGVEKACNELGIHCVTIDALYRVDKQVGDIERMIDENFDAILCTPIDAYALIHPFENAKKRGIAVGSIAQLVPNSTMLCGVDEYDYGVSIGTQAAAWAKDTLNCQGKAVLITQDNVTAAIARSNGIEDTLRRICPTINIVSREAGDYPEGGMGIVNAALQKYPDLNLVIASNDSGGIGGYQAMIANGKTGADRAVFSGDATREAIALMQDPDSIYRGTVNLYPFAYGHESAEVLYRQAIVGLPAKPETIKMSFAHVSKDAVVSGKYKSEY